MLAQAATKLLLSSYFIYLLLSGPIFKKTFGVSILLSIYWLLSKHKLNGWSLMPQWRSNHGDRVDPLSARQINIEPTEEKRYSTTPAQIKDKVYYVPEAENRVGFDSFIKSGTNSTFFNSLLRQSTK
ncbi:hypothetical protein EDB84DRAFT_1440991 [Lactarius hengduanensis]|nr:hypothetical protein EDB84DRAFT_1440991 [Lactarius hengduanensis]